MHTVEMLEHGLDLAARLGYQIRQEYLGGNGGGGCVLKGKKIFFLDLALDPAEQLDLGHRHASPRCRRSAIAHAARIARDAGGAEECVKTHKKPI